jgi:flagellar motility protein MotE (MotC chaperone)/sporulation protein YlmC with PRC-barrel domain
VVDSTGLNIGKIYDLVARTPDPYPRIEKFIISRGSMHQTLLQAKWSEIVFAGSGVITLTGRMGELSAWVNEQSPGSVRLRGDLLDRQIVDTNNRKVVRVNDIHMMHTGSELRIAHLEVGIRGLVRRIGLEKAVDISVKAFTGADNPYLHKEAFVSWKHVELLSGADTQDKARLGVPASRLSDLHPVELAEIMEDLDSGQREALFKSLDNETAAEILSEVDDPKLQETLLSAVGDEKAAEILEEMPPDKAADLLGDMPEEKASSLIGKMEVEDASTLKELLKHDQDTAGGLMTTEFIDIRLGQRVQDVFKVLRSEASEAELIYYLYIVDADGRLTGVMTLKDLILADPLKKVEDVMVHDPASVRVGDGIMAVAEITTKYKVLAVPVVDYENRLKGVITIDDVFDVVLETGWKKKLTRGL